MNPPSAQDSQWLESLGLIGPDCQWQPIDGGCTNQNYVVTDKHTKLFVRMLNPTAISISDRVGEAKLLSHLAEHQLTPELLHFCAERGVQVITFLNSPNILDSHLSTEEKLRHLASCSALIHELGTQDLETLSLAFEIERLCTQLTNLGKAPDSSISIRHLKLARNLDREADNITLCHGDLSLSNLIRHKNHNYLVDWEYARLAPPCYDLAMSIAINQLTTEQADYFLHQYCLHSEASINLERLSSQVSDYLPVVEYINSLWFKLHGAKD